MGAYKQLFLLILFMTIVCLIYYVFPKKYRYFVLIFGSTLFMFYLSRFMTIFVFLSSLILYLITMWMGKNLEDVKEKKSTLEKEEWKAYKNKVKRKNKKILVLGIVLNLGILFCIKYLNFFDSLLNGIFHLVHLNWNIPFIKILLPLGISYYTLSGLGYMIDVYRGKYTYDKNYLHVLLFLIYFPCLLEGPISHYDVLTPQLVNSNEYDGKQCLKGFERVLFGIFKKIVVADRLSILVVAIFDKNPTTIYGYSILIGMIAFTFQLYCEFSGIIDIVVGVSEMFGIQLEKNFERPFFSKSVGEFWRRWHISLGNWFRDYVFYPMSVSKPMMKLSKKLRGKVSSFLETFIPSLIVLFVVWSLTGIWHGASFKYLVYGLYYYVIMMLETLFVYLFRKSNLKEKKWVAGVCIFKTFLLVNVGMLLFRAADLSTGFTMISHMFAKSNYNAFSLIEINEWIILILSFAFVLTISILQERGIHIRESLYKKPLAVQYACLILLIFSIIIFGAYGLGYLPPDPIYGGF